MTVDVMELLLRERRQMQQALRDAHDHIESHKAEVKDNGPPWPILTDLQQVIVMTRATDVQCGIGDLTNESPGSV